MRRRANSGLLATGQRTVPGRALLVLLSVSCLPASQIGAQTPGQGPAPQIQTAARARSSGPPSTSTPESQTAPATGPRSLVTLEDGLLSVNADNASLSDVLLALRAATGADIDLPTNASTERVTAHLGPGPARKILADLLSWSEFDYIIEGSDEDAVAIQSVTLMARNKSGSPSTGSTTFTPSGRSVVPSPARAPQPEIPPAQDVAVVATPTDQPAAVPGAPEAPSSLQPRVAAATTDGGLGGSAPSGGARSPSEMIQELQQMYQQRRQIQQQQNQGQRASP